MNKMAEEEKVALTEKAPWLFPKKPPTPSCCVHFPFSDELQLLKEKQRRRRS